MIGRVLGHQSLKTTEETYAHLALSAVRDALEAKFQLMLNPAPAASEKAKKSAYSKF